MQNPGSPSKTRIGSVGYLNAVPLTCGLEPEVLFATPAELARLLQRDALDAALVSIAEVLRTDRYDVLDGIAIASRGTVKSVLLAHRRPLEELREVFCHGASITGVNLVKVLLAERGVRPRFKPLRHEADAPRCDAVLLIGDPALDFLFGGHEHAILDLGAAWLKTTGLPFVYAAWALRRGAGTTAVRRRLRAAKELGLRTLDAIVRERTEYDLAFRKEYLGGNIRYDLGPDEKHGVAKFVELLRKHGVGSVYEPRFVT